MAGFYSVDGQTAFFFFMIICKLLVAAIRRGVCVEFFFRVFVLLTLIMEKPFFTCRK